MINLAQLSKGYVFDQPMKIGVFQNLLTPASQKELVTHYPTTGFNAIQRSIPPGKLYSFSIMPLVENGQRVNLQLTDQPCWQNLINALMDSQYRNTLEKTLDLDLQDAMINIGLYQFNKADYVDIHLDHKEKIVTQIFYFNTNWDVSNGGFLQLLHNQEPDSCFLTLPPLSIYSVAIVRGDNAWHAVTPVSENSSQSRLSLQLEFYRG